MTRIILGVFFFLLRAGTAIAAASKLITLPVGRYSAFVPTDWDHRQSLPVVFDLHGYGNDGAITAWTRPMAAWRHRIVSRVRATWTVDPGQSVAAAKSWNYASTKVITRFGWNGCIAASNGPWIALPRKADEAWS